MRTIIVYDQHHIRHIQTALSTVRSDEDARIASKASYCTCPLALVQVTVKNLCRHPGRPERKRDISGALLRFAEDDRFSRCGFEKFAAGVQLICFTNSSELLSNRRTRLRSPCNDADWIVEQVVSKLLDCL